MKAIVLVRNGAAEKAFEIQERPVPTPTDNQLLVKAEAFGLNFADVMARQGLYEDAPPLPSVLGYEVVGRIEAIGKDVKGFEVGQRVSALTRFGGYAEYAVTDQRAAVVIPDDMPVGTAAALATQYATAWYCAEEMTSLHSGDHVLIQAAAGGVGTALVQMAKLKGCVVFGTAGSEAKLDYLRSLGVDYPINYSKEDFSTAVRKVVGDRGLDVVFDSVGGSSLKKGFKLLGAGGRVVGYGAAAMSGNKNIFKILGVAWGFGFYSPIPFLMKSRGLIGVNMLRVADERPEALQRSMKAVAQLVADGKLSPTTGAEFHYTEIAKAHEYLGNRSSVGKVVVKWT